LTSQGLYYLLLVFAVRLELLVIFIHSIQLENEVVILFGIGADLLDSDLVVLLALSKLFLELNTLILQLLIVVIGLIQFILQALNLLCESLEELSEHALIAFLYFAQSLLDSWMHCAPQVPDALTQCIQRLFLDPHWVRQS
jgi:hypothetical protein